MSGDRLQISGSDRIAASVTAGLAVGFGVVLGLPIAKLFGWLPAIGAGVVVVAIAAGARYRLTLSDGGFELISFNAWIIPTRRQRFLLDWTVDLYQSFEADTPEGLCLTPPRGFYESETDCFGPTDPERLRTLVEDLGKVQKHLQGKLTATPELQVPLHPGLVEALAPGERSFHPGGRLASAVLARSIGLGGVGFEPGSTAHFNNEEWLDPRRPDRLMYVETATTTPLPLPGAPWARKGARVHFDASGRAQSASDLEPFGWQGMVVGGHLGWAKDGEISSFGLAAPLTVGRFVLPVGASFLRWATPLDRPDWYVILEAPIDHFELGSFRAAVLKRDFSVLRSISIDSDVTVEGTKIHSGRLPIPIRPNGSVDLEACRRLGLTEPG